jgi:hypothetical protein
MRLPPPLKGRLLLFCVSFSFFLLSASGLFVQKFSKRKKDSYKPLFMVYNCPHAVSDI